MATGETSSVRVKRGSLGFTTALASAVLEWLLIFLLFLHALFSYFVTRFARYCELQIPCLLCSRLDHVLGNEKPGFYKNLICSHHKLEISSLVSCQIHDKLANIHEMCESCLFSFASEKNSNHETCRLFLSKLSQNLEKYFDQDPSNDSTLGSSSTGICSCCNEPCSSRFFVPSLIQTKSIGCELDDLDIPKRNSVENSSLHHGSGSRKRREKSSSSRASSHLGRRGFNPLSYVGYTELKITSDSESEVPFSDDDDRSATAMVREANDLKEEFIAQSVKLEANSDSPHILPKTLSDDPALANLIHQPSASEPSFLVSSMKLDVGEAQDITSLASAIATIHSLEEVHPTIIPETLSEDSAVLKSINQDSLPNPSVLVQSIRIDASESHETKFSASAIATVHGLEELNWHKVEQKNNLSAIPEFISTDDVPSSSNFMEAPSEVQEEKLNVKEACNVGQAPIVESGVHTSECGLTTITGPGLKLEQILSDPSLSLPTHMDLSEAYKLAVGNKGIQISGMLTEQLNGKGSGRVKEDLKLLLSQISSARGFDLSLKDSPRVYGEGDESKFSDDSSSVGMQILQKRVSLERNLSGFESLDGSIVSDIEGESLTDRLKRQVEHDRRTMNALYKELEEERNASAIAANQALAMITRLQEEKAALHMEALQYLRMMEEQAEYDVEALQKANDLLTDREKEIQDFEEELEFYRNKYRNESNEEVMQDPMRDLKKEDTEHSDASVPHIEKPEGTDMVFRDNSLCISQDSFLSCEDERLYISQCLKKLEKRLNLFSNNGACLDMANGRHSEKEAYGGNDLEEIQSHKVTQGNVMEEDSLSVQMDSSLSKGNVPSPERYITSAGEHQFVTKENHNLESDALDSSMGGGETDLVALGNEVSDLNDRLEALEVDRNFLEHTFNSLQNGDEGLKFIREIAQHLRELRKIGIRRRELAIA